MSPTTRRAGPRAAAVAALLIAAVLALPAPPAWAHNQVIDTAPGDGTTVEEPVGAVVLRVDHPPLEPLAEHTTITVTSPSGESVAGDVVADQPQRLVEPIPVLLRDDDGEWVQDYHFEAYPLRVPLSSLPEEGEYTVTYSVADSDGHPTEGELSFDYAGTTGAVPASAPDPEPGPTLVTTASAEEAAAAGATADDDEAPAAPAPDQGDGTAVDGDAAVSASDDGSTTGPMLATVGALALLGAGAGMAWRRSHRPAATPSGRTPTGARRRAPRGRAAPARRSPSAKRPR